MAEMTYSRLQSTISLIGFLVLVVGGGLAIGMVTGPDEWFARLTKPSVNPPNWLFAPVWTSLYVMIAIAGWRIRQNGSSGARNKLLWWLQLALNFIWSPIFFVAHRIDLALAVIVLLLVSIIVFIARNLNGDRVAAFLFVPYALWVAFATSLNYALLRLNPAA
ncbi:TspO/MBR family protein [Reyranella sp.]|uniref:TspO/MBR family protein n=1 Tax=Reyranella sp. TaxID=1929291 RepID=UPI0025DE95D2|nr:TspO/MBR family protein [Reyranella sp.]